MSILTLRCDDEITKCHELAKEISAKLTCGIPKLLEKEMKELAEKISEQETFAS